MSKKKKIVLAVSISSIVVLLVGGAIIYLLWFFPTEIEVKDNHWEENESHIILKKSRLCWDTGASCTVLFNDFGQNKTIFAILPVFEYKNKMKFQKFLFSQDITADSVYLKNIIYTDIEKQNVSKWLQEANISGIIGMNVISNYNWLLDFDKKKLQNIPKTKSYKEEYDFKLAYLFRIFPYTNITIEGTKTKRILIDSGFDTDIELLASDIEKINKKIQPDTIINTSSSGLFSNGIPSKKYIYSHIKVNDLSFDTLSINESKRRLIGIGFFRKFDKVFWDSGKKEVRFYKNTKR